MAGTISGPGTQQFPTGAVQAGGSGPSNLIDTFVKGVEAVRLTLVDLRMALTNAVASYAEHPVKAVLAVAGIVAAMVLMQAIYAAVRGNAEAMIVVAFLEGLWKTILTIGSFFQVDTIITLIRLGDMFIDSFHAEIARVYEALGSLSSELSKDMSFVMVFTEASRAIIHSAYAISGNSYLKGEVEFANGMSAWLGGLKDKFDSYMRSPENIFVDIAKTIGEAGKTEADERLGDIVASIDLVAEGTRKAGEEIISLLNNLDEIKRNAPIEIQEAMDVWYKPFREDFDRFIEERWEPFWDKTDKAMAIVTDFLLAHDIDIEAIKETIKTPYDFFMVIFGLPTEAQAAEIKRTRDIMLKLLEDKTVGVDPFAEAHRERLAGSADPLEVSYEPGAREIVIPEKYSEPDWTETDESDSWYRGEY